MMTHGGAALTGPDLRCGGLEKEAFQKSLMDCCRPAGLKQGLSALDRSIESFLAIEIPHFQARAKQGL